MIVLALPDSEAPSSPSARPPPVVAPDPVGGIVGRVPERSKPNAPVGSRASAPLHDDQSESLPLRQPGVRLGATPVALVVLCGETAHVTVLPDHGHPAVPYVHVAR